MVVEQFKSHQNSDESEIKHLWATLFTSLFGYSEALSISNNCSLIKRGNQPVFIVCTNIESKRPSQTLEKELFDYLKLSRLSFGILITSNIELISFNRLMEFATKQETTLDFTTENEKGFNFVELIRNDNFYLSNIITFISDCKEQETISKEIKEKITYETIKKALVEYLKSDYDEKSLVKVIDSINITIGDKHHETNHNFNNLNNLDENILMKGGIKSGTYLKQELISRDLIKENCNFTIAKLNKDSKRELKRYWANPKVEFIYNDWLLVLNDNINRILYFFFIKSNSISHEQINTRILNGKTLIDLEILNKGSIFEEQRTKLDFSNWLVGETKY